MELAVSPGSEHTPVIVAAELARGGTCAALRSRVLIHMKERTILSPLFTVQRVQYENIKELGKIWRKRLEKSSK